MTAGSPIHVTLLTQPQCGYCAHAKEVLRHLAAEYALTVREIELGTPEGQALAERGGVLFPPGIFLDGQFVSYGRPSERRLRRELERRCAPPARI